MIDGIDCPYCVGHTKSVIYCNCGTQKDKYRGDAILHKTKYCNSKYTHCPTYNEFIRGLHSENVKVSICSASTI